MQDTPGNSDAAPEASGRDAIIFVPGMAAGVFDQSVDTVSRRIATAMDRNAVDGRASFVLGEGRDEDYKSGHKTRMITIVRRDGAGERPVADVYELTYHQALTARFGRRPPLLKALSVAGVVLLHLRGFGRSVLTKSRSFAQQAQVVYAAILLSVLVTYAAVVAGTAVATAVELTRGRVGTIATGASPAQGGTETAPAQEGTESPPTQEGTGAPPTGAETNTPPASGLPAGGSGQATTGAESTAAESSAPSPDARWLGRFQSVVVIVAFLGFLVPVDLKAVIERVATEVTPVLSYISTGSRRGSVTGQLADLLDHIIEKQDAGLRYDRIHIVGFSFGSIVALDGIFNENGPSTRFRSVDTLVTIGCPFDMIRAYWPRYFGGRPAPSRVPRWLNYFHSADVLGTDFLAPVGGKGRRGTARRGIGLRDGGSCVPESSVRFGPDLREHNYGFLEWATLLGFRSHIQYWEQDDPTDTGVFELVVRELYAGQPAMA